jgi:hypothetical protein
LPPGAPYDVPSKAKKNEREPIGVEPSMCRPASRQASTMPAASRAPARLALAASVLAQSMSCPPMPALSPAGEMSP